MFNKIFFVAIIFTQSLLGCCFDLFYNCFGLFCNNSDFEADTEKSESEVLACFADCTSETSEDVLQLRLLEVSDESLLAEEPIADSIVCEKKHDELNPTDILRAIVRSKLKYFASISKSPDTLGHEDLINKENQRILVYNAFVSDEAVKTANEEPIDYINTVEMYQKSDESKESHELGMNIYYYSVEYYENLGDKNKTVRINPAFFEITHNGFVYKSVLCSCPATIKFKSTKTKNEFQIKARTDSHIPIRKDKYNQASQQPSSISTKPSNQLSLSTQAGKTIKSTGGRMLSKNAIFFLAETSNGLYRNRSYPLLTESEKDLAKEQITSKSIEPDSPAWLRSFNNFVLEGVAFLNRETLDDQNNQYYIPIVVGEVVVWKAVRAYMIQGEIDITGDEPARLDIEGIVKLVRIDRQLKHSVEKFFKEDFDQTVERKTVKNFVQGAHILSFDGIQPFVAILKREVGNVISMTYCKIVGDFIIDDDEMTEQEAQDSFAKYLNDDSSDNLRALNPDEQEVGAVIFDSTSDRMPSAKRSVASKISSRSFDFTIKLRDELEVAINPEFELKSPDLMMKCIFVFKINGEPQNIFGYMLVSKELKVLKATLKTVGFRTLRLQSDPTEIYNASNYCAEWLNKPVELLPDFSTNLADIKENLSSDSIKIVAGVETKEELPELIQAYQSMIQGELQELDNDTKPQYYILQVKIGESTMNVLAHIFLDLRNIKKIEFIQLVKIPRDSDQVNIPTPTMPVGLYEISETSSSEKQQRLLQNKEAIVKAANNLKCLGEFSFSIQELQANLSADSVEIVAGVEINPLYKNILSKYRDIFTKKSKRNLTKIQDNTEDQYCILQIKIGGKELDVFAKYVNKKIQFVSIDDPNKPVSLIPVLKAFDPERALCANLTVTQGLAANLIIYCKDLWFLKDETAKSSSYKSVPTSSIDHPQDHHTKEENGCWWILFLPFKMCSICCD